MMRYLLLSSFLFLASCASNTQPVTIQHAHTNCLAKAAPVLKNELYNASVDVYGNHISGLMFFKIMPDTSQSVVFTTETGLTIFNFSWNKLGKFKVQHVIKKLDRKVVINLLRKDLQLILIPKTYSAKAISATDGTQAVTLRKETAFFSVSENCRSIEKAEVRYNENIKTRVFFFPQQKNIPDSVYIEHLNFNMQLAFGRINRDHASE